MFTVFVCLLFLACRHPLRDSALFSNLTCSRRLSNGESKQVPANCDTCDDKYCLQTFSFLGGVPGRHWSQQTDPRYKGGSINAPLAIPLSFHSWYVLLEFINNYLPVTTFTAQETDSLARPCEVKCLSDWLSWMVNNNSLNLINDLNMIYCRGNFLLQSATKLLSHYSQMEVFGEQSNVHPSSLPSIQRWVACCFLQIARAAVQC